MRSPEDERIARLLIAIRRRTGRRQLDIARLAGIPREDVLRIEAGEAGTVRLDRLRRIFDAAGGRARLGIWWDGAAADRLLDERHAAIVERCLEVLERRGWATKPEVSFSEFGERGSIDVLGAKHSASAVAVCEVKTALGSLEETNRVLDAKVRLAPVIAERTFGWRPRIVGRILIVPASSSIRRLVSSHALTMANLYPARSREVRAWLHEPTESLRGIWFVSEVAVRNPKER